MPAGFMVLSALGSGLLWMWSAPRVVAGTPRLCSRWPAVVSKNGASLPNKAAGAAATDGAEAHATDSEFWEMTSFPHLLSATPPFLPCVIPKPFAQCIAQILTCVQKIFLYFFFKQMSVKILCHKQRTAFCLISPWGCVPSSHLSLWSGDLNTHWNVNQAHHINTLKLAFGFIKGSPCTTNRLWTPMHSLHPLQSHNHSAGWLSGSTTTQPVPPSLTSPRALWATQQNKSCPPWSRTEWLLSADNRGFLFQQEENKRILSLRESALKRELFASE